MNAKVLRWIAAGAVVGGVALVVAGAAHRISDIHVAGGTVRLAWEPATNRLIVERAASLDNWTLDALCVGSTAAAITNALVLPDQPPARAFYRARFGMRVVEFPDVNLRLKVQSKIVNKHSPANAIYDVDLAGITFLSCGGVDVKSLAGLEAMTDLQWLGLSDNPITNGAPISALANLEFLSLEETQISDWSFLASLTNLVTLSLSHNQITDLSPLEDLLRLTEVGLCSCPITDLTSLIRNAENGGLGPGDRVAFDFDGIADTNQIAILRDGFGVTVHNCGHW